MEAAQLWRAHNTILASQVLDADAQQVSCCTSFVSTHCLTAARPLCRTAALPHGRSAARPLCRTAALPHCRSAALPLCESREKQPFLAYPRCLTLSSLPSLPLPVSSWWSARRVIAMVGDSLMYEGFLPSMLCQVRPPCSARYAHHALPGTALHALPGTALHALPGTPSMLCQVRPPCSARYALHALPGTPSLLLSRSLHLVLTPTIPPLARGAHATSDSPTPPFPPVPFPSPPECAQIHRVSAVSKVTDDGLSKFVWRVAAYNVTIVNYWSPFLMAYSTQNDVLRRIKVTNPGLGDTAVNLHTFDPTWFDKVGRFGMVVFQSATHWPHAKTWLRRFFVNRKWQLIKPEPNTVQAYKMALRRLARTFDAKSVKRWRLPPMYFLSAPPRLAGCQGAKTPSSPQMYSFFERNNSQSRVWYPSQANVFKGSRTIRLIDITHPSLFRSDAMIAAQRRKSQDCLHPCMPGLPDTWVDLFYETWRREHGVA
ncbi:unnamed protein product [Closterium sp. NIES-65]|nr:unnamed protein product [Closterium sp. NIES-65]